MRRLFFILGLALITTMMVSEVREFFVTNEGVRYYSVEPLRLLYVAVLGVTGGVAALVISRLSADSQRKLKLAALGTSCLFLLAIFVLLAYCLGWAAQLLEEARMWGWVAVVLISLLISAGLVWLEFRQVWRRK